MYVIRYLIKIKRIFHKNFFNTANEKISMCMLSGSDPVRFRNWWWKYKIRIPDTGVSYMSEIGTLQYTLHIHFNNKHCIVVLNCGLMERSSGLWLLNQH
jgi:hypothetical protein